MAKDYSDYIAMILDSGERVYHMYHFNNTKKIFENFDPFKHNGHTYSLSMNRAYRIKWAPWKKLKWKRPIWTLNEFIRSKKIGLLLYQEPPPRKIEKKLIDVQCTCGFKGKNMKGIKIHASSQTPPHKLIEKFEDIETPLVKEPIEPMHISRVHQPSGEMKG